MGGQQIDCPLCCDKTFDSKQSLFDHLNNVMENLYCPLCNSKWTTLEGLTEHLSLYDCQTVQNETVQNIVIYEQGIHVENIENSEDIKDHDIKTINDVTDLTTTESDTQYITDQTYHGQDESGEVNKMYVELLSNKPMSEPVLETGELQLIKDEGEGRYMIVTQENGELRADTAIVTKQNNDGTISLTTVKDIKLETETLIAPEPDSANSEQEVYSCTACKVSFTEVLEHVNKYHRHQEVLLEDIAAAVISPNEVTELSQMDVDEASMSSDKQAPRRVITDTGNIVEEPVIYKGPNTEVVPNTIDKIIKHPKLILDKQGREYTRRYVPIDKLERVNKPLTNADGSPVGPVSYECEVCNTVFPTNKSLKLHKRMHDPIKSRPIEPPVANSEGTDVSQALYRCNICEKMIPFDYRTIHENSHKSSDKMNCSICNKKFSSIEYLEMHINVHNLDKVTVSKQDKSLAYKCVYCNRRFARPHEKVKHERIHTGEKPHSCEICGKSFRVSYCLTLHMRTHTGARPYACPHCGKRFKAHSVYNHHLLTHSEVRAYKCPFCPKAFKTSVQLAGHKNSHTKPFSCQHCNRPFASLYAVRVHTETHLRQNNLKFSCSLCGASYARAFALNDHVKHTHRQEIDDGGLLQVSMNTQDELTRESTAETETLTKELQQDITELGMSNNELIVP